MDQALKLLKMIIEQNLTKKEAWRMPMMMTRVIL
jgi:hypothetical protein